MRREYRFAISAVSALVLFLFAALPQAAWSAVPSVCVFKNALGVDCLGCGMTRALASAMHGHFSEALALNAGVTLLVPMLLAGVGVGLRR
jgi:hypothetical protein